MARVSSFVLVVAAVAIGAAMIPAATAATTNTTATGTATAPATATAASTPTATEISTATATGTATETPGEPDTNPVRYQLGPNTQILGYSYSDGVFRVKVKATIPTRIVVSDALGPLSESGVSEVPQRSVFVDGTQTVQMDVEEYQGGAGVSVSSSSGTVYISAGVGGRGNPFEGGSPTVGWIGGAVVAVLMFALAGLWTLRKEGNEPKKAGRDS